MTFQLAALKNSFVIIGLCVLLFSISYANEGESIDYEMVQLQVLNEAIELNENGTVLGAWQKMREGGDSYAKMAVNIFSEEITLENCLIAEVWRNAVGDDMRKMFFPHYAKVYQSKYLNFTKENMRLPNTSELETLYAETADELRLPRTVSIDLLMNTASDKSCRSNMLNLFSNMIGFGKIKSSKKWWDYTELPEVRISTKTLKIDTISNKDAEIALSSASFKAAKCWFIGRGAKRDF